jgi:hypothetical protein
MMSTPQYNTLSATSTQGTKVSKKRLRRKVTFATTCNSVLVQVESRKEDRFNAWYSQGELDFMRKAVKGQAKHYKVALGSIKLKTSVNSTNMSSLVMPFKNSGVEMKTQVLCISESFSGSNSTFRGLEPRIFIERQRNRMIASKTVLEYQRRTLDLLQVAQRKGFPKEKVEAMKEAFSVRLGEICSQLSAWSRDEALSTAMYDATGDYGRFVCEKALDNNLDNNVSPQCRVSATVLRDRSINTMVDPSSYQSSAKRKLRCIYNSHDQVIARSKRSRTPCQILQVEIEALTA